MRQMKKLVANDKSGTRLGKGQKEGEEEDDYQIIKICQFRSQLFLTTSPN